MSCGSHGEGLDSAPLDARPDFTAKAPRRSDGGMAALSGVNGATARLMAPIRGFRGVSYWPTHPQGWPQWGRPIERLLEWVAHGFRR